MHDFHALPIIEVKPETADAICVVLAVPEELRAAFAFRPGQHLPVRARLDGEEQRRTYSICAVPSDGRLRIAIKRVAGGAFSNWANDTLRPGALLEAMPPAGRFVLPAGDGGPRHILALAAGAGITPIIAIIRQTLASEPNASVTLIYGNRSPQTIMFREELEALKDRHLGRFTLLHVLSHNEESSAPLFEGRINGDKIRAFAAGLFKPDQVAHVFLCGPGSMIKDVRTTLLELGVPRERVHHEFFAPAGGASRRREAVPVPPAAPAREGGGEARRESVAAGSTEAIAVLDGIRHRFIVPAGGQVVDAALAAGIRVPYSCKGGMCCTCRAKLVEGKAEMRVNYSLEPWEIERGFILTCQAVPKSERIVVDYDAM
jgi:ring-1,2-phenylacetyl-CoA epoxidase subunit PaaE